MEQQLQTLLAVLRNSGRYKYELELFAAQRVITAMLKLDDNKSVSDIARAADMSDAPVRNELARLVRLGVVSRKTQEHSWIGPIHRPRKGGSHIKSNTRVTFSLVRRDV